MLVGRERHQDRRSHPEAAPRRVAGGYCPLRDALLSHRRLPQGNASVNEELYNNSAGKLLETAQPVAKGKQTFKNKDGKERVEESVVAWTNTYNGKTKVFATTLGHNNDTVADARYLDLVTRGLLWSVGKLDETYLKPAKKVMIDEK
jgi:hypothetical protein